MKLVSSSIPQEKNFLELLEKKILPNTSSMVLIFFFKNIFGNLNRNIFLITKKTLGKNYK